MQNRIKNLVTVLIMFCPLLALAAGEDPADSPSFLVSLFWTIFPILLIALLVWFFFVKTIRKHQARAYEAIDRQQKHNERVEQLLERIAQAVEKDDQGKV